MPPAATVLAAFDAARVTVTTAREHECVLSCSDNDSLPQENSKALQTFPRTQRLHAPNSDLYSKLPDFS